MGSGHGSGLKALASSRPAAACSKAANGQAAPTRSGPRLPGDWPPTSRPSSPPAPAQSLSEDWLSAPPPSFPPSLPSGSLRLARNSGLFVPWSWSADPLLLCSEWRAGPLPPLQEPRPGLTLGPGTLSLTSRRQSDLSSKVQGLCLCASPKLQLSTLRNSHRFLKEDSSLPEEAATKNETMPVKLPTEVQMQDQIHKFTNQSVNYFSSKTTHP
ncbi:uncharacterized protein ACOB7L_021476 [Callospermophilus lateralis]|uniref:uncharacterized protein LOC143405636 n=1 Tax=Callospermophilus lateralis TaxID=76772 RepID=UPI004038C99A